MNKVWSHFGLVMNRCHFTLAFFFFNFKLLWQHISVLKFPNFVLKVMHFKK